MFETFLPNEFLIRVSGPRYNSKFAGSLYLGWYLCSAIAIVAGCYTIYARPRIEILWCYDSPHTFRDFSTSMQTEIIVYSKDVVSDYTIDFTTGFQNSDIMSEAMRSKEDSYSCKWHNSDDYQKLI